jgi:DNA-binding response OmpR family regulator
MSRAPDANGGKGDGGLGPVRILVADADCALFGLLEEWFAASGWQLAGACQPEETALDGYDLILVDVPFPREGGQDVLKSLAREHPGTPIIALSSSFFPGVESDGAVARELGVAAVLPKPVARGALLATVQRVLHRAP